MNPYLGLLAALILAVPARAEIKLLATLKIPGNSTDQSGLTEKLGEGTPHNRLGGFGSGIDRLDGDRYVLMPDRGPKDGGSKYQCRFQIAKIKLNGDKIDFDLLESVILRDPMGRPYLGDLNDLARRLDPEDIRAAKNGNVYISDEYGPKILEFDLAGKQIREFKVPDRFLTDRPHGDPKIEASAKKGRAPNRGFEGLALTPAGKLVAMLQSPLIQDGGFDGRNIRILELDPTTEKTREFVYPMDPQNGVNAILAIGENDFLVLERDSVAGTKRYAKIYRINTAQATDVSGVGRLAKSGQTPGVTPVTKTLFLDLATLGLTLPEKIEGLAFGPDFADGRNLLFVTTDNDFTELPSQIFAFAVDL